MRSHATTFDSVHGRANCSDTQSVHSDGQRLPCCLVASASGHLLIPQHKQTTNTLFDENTK